MRGRALLIATSRYRDERLPDLSSAVLDARGLQEVLADPRIGDFAVEVCLDASCDQVRARIEDFFKTAVSDDLLLLYLSGHGLKDQAGRLCFAATDTNQERLLSTAIASSYINDAVNAGRSRRVVMIFDACFSGAFARDWEIKAGSQVNVEESFRASTGSFVITASDAIQYAHGRQGQPSLFSKHLIAGLRTGKADLNGDGDVGVEELYQYVATQVRREQSDQEPRRWVFGVDGDLVVAANPEPPPGKLPQEVRQLMDSPLASGRLAAVVELERLLAHPSRPTALAARQALQWLHSNDNRTVSEAAGAALSRDGGRPGPGPAAGSSVPGAASAPARGRVGTSGSRPCDDDPAGRAGRRGRALLLAGAVAAGLAVAALLGGHVFLDGSGHSHHAVPVLSAHPSSAATQRPAAAPAAYPALSASSAASQAGSLPSLTSMRPGTVFQDCRDCLKMVRVPTGSFHMGSPAGEEGRDDNEGPVHTVTISYPLAVSEYPVTRGQWRQYLTSTRHQGSDHCVGIDESTGKLAQKAQFSWRNPGFEQQDDHPVVCVSWQEAHAYAQWLSEKTHRSYRLLTEAEYEYVNRAGTTTIYFWGNDVAAGCRYANIGDGSLKARYSDSTTVGCDDGYVFTSPVGSFQANRFGLFDTAGNVYSWTADCWHDSYTGAPEDGSAWVRGGDCQLRVLRGGSWFEGPYAVRAARRFMFPASSTLLLAGFRLARTQ